jgi:hypothetical protein
MFGPLPIYDPLGDLPPNLNNPDRNTNDEDDFATQANQAALIAWQERQRRQRTLRMLMMLLMVLLLMDGDEPPDRRNPRMKHHNNMRSRGEGGTLADRSRGKYNKLGMFIDEHGDLITSLNREVYNSRRDEDKIIIDAIRDADHRSSRYSDLVKKNNGRDVEKELRDWVEQKVLDETKLTLALDDDTLDGVDHQERIKSHLAGEVVDAPVPRNIAPTKSEADMKQMDDMSVFHYPRNATGYYRGMWLRLPTNISNTHNSWEKKHDPFDGDAVEGDSSGVSVSDIQQWTQKELAHRKEDVSLILLPPDLYLEVDPSDKSTSNNTAVTSGDDYWNGFFPSTGGEAALTSSSSSSSLRNKSTTTKAEVAEKPPTLSLTKEAGRAAFQLYSRPIPAMDEISIVDGLVKLYDGMTTSFVSRRTDVLLRVRGIVVHSIGKMSLVTASTSNGSYESRRRSVLGVRQVKQVAATTEKLQDDDDEEVVYVPDQSPHLGKRRLQSTLHDYIAKHNATIHAEISSEKGLVDDLNVALKQIREDVMDLYFSHYAHDIISTDNHDITASSEAMKLDGWTLIKSVDEDDILDAGKVSAVRRLLEEDKLVEHEGDSSMSMHANAPADEQMGMQRTTLLKQNSAPSSNVRIQPSYEYVYPFPYVLDDSEDSMKKASSPASRRLPNREMVLEANAANCEFEINVDIQEAKWTLGDWRATMEQRVRMIHAFNPYLKTFDTEIERLKRSQILMIKSQTDFYEEEGAKEILVLSMTGSIDSPNCQFNSFVNVTAIRTNWEHTTAKAINYSFYMMLTCLTQIVVLLRQLLHTQAQSAASNVSLMCIGWQTVLDAILCIAHIFLCLVMQPLFTAFASVAFFKLLIFCVIEMKYMALIIQARNNTNNPGHTQDDLRRQITMLHFRFYAALMIAIMSFWYFGQSQRMFFILVLYSFWIPQIVLNIITESRKPMHPYYIYGMSFTRLVAPLYVFAVQKNFLKEVNPGELVFQFMSLYCYQRKRRCPHPSRFYTRLPIRP